MSPMGDSAGRSSGNRTGAGARRRNTQRERALIDPPWAEQAINPPYSRAFRLLCLVAFLAPLGALLTAALLLLG